MKCPECDASNFIILAKNEFGCTHCKTLLSFKTNIKSDVIKIVNDETIKIVCPNCKSGKFKKYNNSKFVCVDCDEEIEFSKI